MALNWLFLLDFNVFINRHFNMGAISVWLPDIADNAFLYIKIPMGYLNEWASFTLFLNKF